MSTPTNDVLAVDKFCSVILYAILTIWRGGGAGWHCPVK